MQMLRALIGLIGLLALTTSSSVAAPQEKQKDEKPKFKLTETEQKILDLTNQARATDDLPPLKPNPTLFEMARKHSENQAKQRKMDHVLDGKNPSDRAKDTGYRYAALGENVAAGD